MLRNIYSTNNDAIVRQACFNHAAGSLSAAATVRTRMRNFLEQKVFTLLHDHDPGIFGVNVW